MKKRITKEVILYLVFGVLTTVINIVSFYIMSEKLKWNENIANFIAIMLAIICAYFTNKDMVFHSKAENLKEKVIEFFKFISGRGFTILFEFVGGLILFKTVIPEIISKLVLTTIVIILNFFISKYFTFKDKKKEGQLVEDKNTIEN